MDANNTDIPSSPPTPLRCTTPSKFGCVAQEHLAPPQEQPQEQTVVANREDETRTPTNLPHNMSSSSSAGHSQHCFVEVSESEETRDESLHEEQIGTSNAIPQQQGRRWPPTPLKNYDSVEISIVSSSPSRDRHADLSCSPSYQKRGRFLVWPVSANSPAGIRLPELGKQ